MKKHCLRIILLGLALALLSGCAPGVKKAPEEIGRVPFEVLKKDLCQIYARIGREYERAGELVSALKHYKLALTVSPFDQEADEGRNKFTRPFIFPADSRIYLTQVFLEYFKGNSPDFFRRLLHPGCATR